MTVRHALVAVLLALVSPLAGAAAAAFEPEPGDLLFQDLDAGPLCDAIETVTWGRDMARLSHIGIVAREGDRMVVLEAYGDVRATPLDEFLARSADAEGRPKVFVGRLKPELRREVHRAVAYARGLLGAAYDHAFLPDNGAYYCSEMVQLAYRDADGQPIFELAPMTFRAPGGSAPMGTWVKHYDALGLAVPEGAPGCNPAGLSRSEALDIVWAYGRPTGWTEAILSRYPGVQASGEE